MDIATYAFDHICQPTHFVTVQGTEYDGVIEDFSFENRKDGELIFRAFDALHNIRVPSSHIKTIEPYNNTHKDNVNHPSHYQSESGLEVIDVIDAFTEDLSGEEAFCTGNAIKYICRWKSKNGVEDLKKAKWYIDRMINKLEKGENKTC